ncbi:MAG: UDP-N-acetylmuramoyl-tripeptide--D-alanyl-D-alanine ligase, partial [Firmicutes bacterium]|nr:UDP-N-acetylmuramoyl-tripeptide--D-alanyl-D-alanine ligase [Bacillota bacterium]
MTAGGGRRALFTGREAARVAEGRLRGSPDAVITGAASDSRRARPGDLFVAIRGERVDGHDFVPTAVAQGATAVLVERVDPAWALPPGVAVIQVDNAVLALGRLALHHRRRFPVRVTAVTGSVGKTSTKDLIASVLVQGFRLLKTEGNLNTEIGLPLTLFRLDAGTEAAVVEMGMRGLGQIRYLASLAEPAVGVITNIGRTHLELLGSEENIARAKAELVEALPEDGFAVLKELHEEKWAQYKSIPILILSSIREGASRRRWELETA